MTILIIEDEEPAYRRLQKMLKELEPDHTLLNQIVSVSSAVKWFKENKAPDLIISDIQLSDGISFEILNVRLFSQLLTISMPLKHSR